MINGFENINDIQSWEFLLNIMIDNDWIIDHPETMFSGISYNHCCSIFGANIWLVESIEPTTSNWNPGSDASSTTSNIKKTSILDVGRCWRWMKWCRGTLPIMIRDPPNTPGNNTWQLKCVPNFGGCLSVLQKTGNFPLQHLSRQPWTTPEFINFIPNLWSYPIVP